MVITKGNRIVAITTVVTAVAAGTPVTSGTLVTARHSTRIMRDQAAADRYWTPDRMRAATRNAWNDGNTMGSGLRWVHAGAVGRTTGKVFFTLHGTDYVCSGSTVSGPGGADVVLTAAHCAGDGAGRWSAHWTFVPGYTDGAEPYGAYTARRFFVPPRWADSSGGGAGGPDAVASAASERYDIAFVAVNPSNGRPLGAVTGGQRADFGSQTRTAAYAGTGTYVFGYPSEPPYSGMYPNFCAGAARPAAKDGAIALRCAMTAGDSGGPWFSAFSPRRGTGTIVAVTTYKLNGDASPLYGTLLGPEARALYDQAVAATRATR